ncbi:NUDIX hydrolase [Saccharothrix sp. HUAS TT1]|uniref:NUDIX hydrolase n=1 Tax=unclassified Saccharothrix TaxID=2593673 RepID=UPI00345BADC5
MAVPTSRSPGVELLDVTGLRLVEVDQPPIPAAERIAMDRAWQRQLRANPALFDGPVVVCAGVEPDGPGALLISWVRTTYRFFALRRVPGATSLLPSLFVCVVQPADDGRLLVGRASRTGAVPGRWQLPGGSVEPPAEREPLDLAALRRHAVRELAEETGVTATPDDLSGCLVTRGRNGNVGVVFVAPSRPAAHLRDRFASLPADEAARGREPEFDRIALVGSAAEAADLGPVRADYLEPVVRLTTAR